MVSNEINIDDDLDEEMFPVSDSARLVRTISAGYVDQSEVMLFFCLIFYIYLTRNKN